MKIFKYFVQFSFLSMFIFIATVGCSSANDASNKRTHSHIQLASNTNHVNLSDYRDWDNGLKKLGFHDEDDIYWKVILDEGEIIELYRDGERIPDDEIEEYEDFIFEKMDEIEDELEELEWELDELGEELSNINLDLDFDFDFDEFEFEFDREEFEESMSDLREELKNLKKHNYNFKFEFDDEDWNCDDHTEKHWDSHDFKKEMKELKHNLRHLEDLDINIDIELNMEEFNEGMLEFAESMKNLKIDLSGLDETMAELDIEMGELKVEMKKLKNFLNDVSSELVSDGYIEDEDEDYDLVLDENKMIVNGERLPDELHRKYLDIYKDNYGKELDDTFRINR